MKTHIGLVIALLNSGLSVVTCGQGAGTEADPYQIWTNEQMNNIGVNPDIWNKWFKLMADIDMSFYSGTKYNIIGNQTAPFTGTFDGNGYALSHLIYSSSTPVNYVGVFGYTAGSTIKNLRLENGSITSSGNYVGGLIGFNDGAVINCSGNCDVEGNYWVGGLIGWNNKNVSNCYHTGLTNGSIGIGGVIGYNNTGFVNGCYSTGNVNGGFYCGGLVGYNNEGIINACCSTRAVIGNGDNCGGLVGANHGTIRNCYSDNSVGNGDNYSVGGLAGFNSGVIESCYCVGTAWGNDCVGGLVGLNEAFIRNCYSAGIASGGDNIGGLAGMNSSVIRHCYSATFICSVWLSGGLVGRTSTISNYIEMCFWDIEVSGTISGVGDGPFEGVGGLTTAQMQTASIFINAGWDFLTPIWMICGQDYPRLIWFAPDINNDGITNLSDFMVLVEQWLITDCGFCSNADLTGDGSINLYDFSVFSGKWLWEEFGKEEK